MNVESIVYHSAFVPGDAEIVEGHEVLSPQTCLLLELDSRYQRKGVLFMSSMKKGGLLTNREWTKWNFLLEGANLWFHDAQSNSAHIHQLAHVELLVPSEKFPHIAYLDEHDGSSSSKKAFTVLCQNPQCFSNEEVQPDSLYYVDHIKIYLKAATEKEARDWVEDICTGVRKRQWEGGLGDDDIMLQAEVSISKNQYMQSKADISALTDLESFEGLLGNSILRAAFAAFLEAGYMDEVLLFWEHAEDYRRTCAPLHSDDAFLFRGVEGPLDAEDRREWAQSIFNRFLAEGAPLQIADCSGEERDRLEAVLLQAASFSGGGGGGGGDGDGSDNADHIPPSTSGNQGGGNNDPQQQQQQQQNRRPPAPTPFLFTSLQKECYRRLKYGEGFYSEFVAMPGYRVALQQALYAERRRVVGRKPLATCLSGEDRFTVAEKGGMPSGAAGARALEEAGGKRSGSVVDRSSRNTLLASLFSGLKKERAAAENAAYGDYDGGNHGDDEDNRPLMNTAWRVAPARDDLGRKADRKPDWWWHEVYDEYYDAGSDEDDGDGGGGGFSSKGHDHDGNNGGDDGDGDGGYATPSMKVRGEWEDELTAIYGENGRRLLHAGGRGKVALQSLSNSANYLAHSATGTFGENRFVGTMWVKDLNLGGSEYSHNQYQPQQPQQSQQQPQQQQQQQPGGSGGNSASNGAGKRRFVSMWCMIVQFRNRGRLLLYRQDGSFAGLIRLELVTGIHVTTRPLHCIQLFEGEDAEKCVRWELVPGSDRSEQQSYFLLQQFYKEAVRFTAGDAVSVVFAGPMEKKGDSASSGIRSISYKPRWLVLLSSGVLAHYRPSDSLSAQATFKGEVYLGNNRARVRIFGASGPTSLSVELPGSNKTYQFRAADKESRDAWAAVLGAATVPEQQK